MLKISGIVCICGFCLYIGFYTAGFFRKNVFLLSETVRLVGQLEISLEFLRLTREQVKEQLCGQFPELRGIINDGFEGRRIKSINFEEQDRRKLEEMFEMIGGCDLNGQLSSLEFYKHYFNSRYENLLLDLERKNKLCMGLGACAAAFVGVMLI